MPTPDALTERPCPVASRRDSRRASSSPGTEVLTGRIADSNGPWISERLAELGVEVAHILIVGDRPDDLEAALRFLAAEGMDLIVTSGGLGPTADDLTARGGRPLRRPRAGARRGDGGEDRRDPARLRRARFDFDEEAVMEANRKQAMVPEGAIALDPVGTAPGLVVPAGERVVVVLPGPPRELQPMWPAALATAAGAGGAGAGDAAARLHAADVRRPRVGDRQEPARDRGRRGRRSTRSRSPPACAAARSRSTSATATRRRRSPTRCARGSRERHERQLFSLDGETIDAAGGEAAARAGGWAWPSPAAAACWRRGSPTCRAPPPTWRGGVVAYSNEAKAELLGVDPALIEAKGAVSPEVAEAMAIGALERFGADVAVSITGIAGPDGGTRGEAGRLRLLQRPPRRRHRDRPRPGDPRRPRRHPRTLGPGRHAPAADPARRRRAAALGAMLRSRA